MLLITGAAGFIGSCFARRASLRGDALCLIDKLTYAGSRESLAGILDRPQVRFFAQDICHAAEIRNSIQHFRPRTIVHFAAETHVDRSIEGPDVFMQTNVVGTARLASAALAYWQTLSPELQRDFRFVHISTDEVYGPAPPGQRFDELAPYRPSSPYAASKAASNHVVLSYWTTYGLPVAIANLCNCFGPYQYPEKLIPLMILRAAEGRSLPVYGDGQHRRQWMYVEDAVDAIERLCHAAGPGEIYNVGSDYECTNLEMVHHICDAVAEATGGDPRGLRNLVQFVADRPGHDRRYAMDWGKVSQATGWQASSRIDTALRATVRWYLESRAWVQRVRSAASHRRGLAFLG